MARSKRRHPVRRWARARSQGHKPYNVRARLCAVPWWGACVGRSSPDLPGYFSLDMTAALRYISPPHTGYC